VRKATPQKMYYSISEASTLAGEEQYILRYWEREFEELRPRKNRAGNRAYNEKDLAVLLDIRKLLREGNYSIKEAKKEITRRYGQPNTAVKTTDGNTAAAPRKEKYAGKAKKKAEITTEIVVAPPPKHATVVLSRRDVLELCSLLKDMALLIRSL